MKRIIFIATLLLFPVLSYSATTNVNCTNASTVNTAISDASNGDTLNCTTAGWSSGTVTLPSTKYVTLKGNGLTVSAGLVVQAHATGNQRVTGFVFTNASTISIGETGGSLTTAPWRFDNNVLYSNANPCADVCIDIGTNPGVFDNNTMYGGVAAETIHLNGWGAGDRSGWSDEVAPGTAQQIYLENNTFYRVGSGQTNAYQAYYGTRVVFRYNTMGAGVQVDHHGNLTPKTRWWEIYKNTANGVPSFFVNSRGGSGVVFGNTTTQTEDNKPIYLSEEGGASYPQLDQIGRGKDQALTPAYVWGNTSPGIYVSLYPDCDVTCYDVVALNRDFYTPSSGTSLPGTCTTGQGYWKTDDGGNWDTTNGTSNDGKLYKCTSDNNWTAYYTPYTYPHPLTGGSSSSSTPVPSIRFHVVPDDW